MSVDPSAAGRVLAIALAFLAAETSLIARSQTVSSSFFHSQCEAVTGSIGAGVKQGDNNPDASDVRALISAAELVAGKLDQPDCSLYERVLQRAGGLELSGVHFHNIRLLESFQMLTSLTLSNDGLHDLNGIEKLVGLQSLDVSNNDIGDLKSAAPLIKLQVLKVSNNKVTDLTPISSMSRLRWLDAHFNDIRDIKVLNKLPLLMWIEMGQNQVSDVAGLDPMFSIVGYIDLNENSVMDGTVIPGDANRHVDLSNNPADQIYNPPRATLPQLRPLLLRLGASRLNRSDIQLRVVTSLCGPARAHAEDPFDFSNIATPCGPYWE